MDQGCFLFEKSTSNVTVGIYKPPIPDVIITHRNKWLERGKLFLKNQRNWTRREKIEALKIHTALEDYMANYGDEESDSKLDEICCILDHTNVEKWSD